MEKILQVVNPRYTFASTMVLPVILEAGEINSIGDAYVKSQDLLAAGCSEECLSFKGWWMPSMSYRRYPSDKDLEMYPEVNNGQLLQPVQTSKTKS